VKIIDGKPYYAIGLTKPGIEVSYGDSHHETRPYYTAVFPLWADFQTLHYIWDLTFFTGDGLSGDELYLKIKELVEFTQKTSILKEFSFMYGLRPSPEDYIRQVFAFADSRAKLRDWLIPWSHYDLYVKYPYYKLKASILNKLGTIKR
jgi:hypothetical protein